jgi:flavin-dependent dehydrogenase
VSEAIIVGAGPAGAIAAIVLARAGVRVAVLDRARFPRDKLCGDTVNPGALAILDRLGLSDVAADGLPVAGMLVTGESGVRCEGLYGGDLVGRALSRRVLDAALVAAAAKAGVCIEEAAIVQGPLVEDGQVTGVLVASANGHARPIRAPVVIAADGASSRLARALRLSHHRARPRRWAVGAYFENVAPGPSAHLVGEMHLRRGRYIGIAPLPDGVTNACVVTADRLALRDPAALLHETLRSDRQIAHRFAAARAITRPVCLGPLAVDNVASGVPGVFLAGDAAGFIDPMTGDGLRFALRGGELAAAAALAVLEHGARDAHHALRQSRQRAFAAKWRFNRALRALAGSPLALTIAARSAELSPGWLKLAIRYAGDCE